MYFLVLFVLVFQTLLIIVVASAVVVVVVVMFWHRHMFSPFSLAITGVATKTARFRDHAPSSSSASSSACFALLLLRATRASLILTRLGGSERGKWG